MAPQQASIATTPAPNDVKLIAIGPPGETGAVTRPHATAITGDAVRRSGDGLALRVGRVGRFQTRSDGRTILSFVEALPSPIRLDRWSLVMESWTSDGIGLPELDHTQRRRLPAIAVVRGANGHLQGWPALGHPDKAGIGHYATDATLPASWGRGDGALPDPGQGVDTFRVSVNGAVHRPSSYRDTSRIHIGAHLHGGANRIEVRVATPLRNAVESITKGRGAADRHGTDRSGDPPPSSRSASGPLPPQGFEGNMTQFQSGDLLGERRCGRSDRRRTSGRQHGAKSAGRRNPCSPMEV